jgi:hypothetical protein
MMQSLLQTGTIPRQSAAQPTYIVEAYARHCAKVMADWCRTEFKLTAAQGARWEPKVYISFSPRIKRSRGGLYKDWSPAMRLALAYSRRDGLLYNEYDHYARDPEIGHFLCKTWQQKVALTIAHEIAHVVQFSLSAFVNPIEWDNVLFDIWGTAKNRHKAIDGHKEFFQHIYRKIRNKFVNGKGFIPIAEPNYIAPSKPMRKRKLPQVIGQVQIRAGLNRGRWVQGTFPLLGKAKDTKKGRIVTILHKDRALRIKIFSDNGVTYLT